MGATAHHVRGCLGSVLHPQPLREDSWARRCPGTATGGREGQRIGSRQALPSRADPMSTDGRDSLGTPRLHLRVGSRGPETRPQPPGVAGIMATVPKPESPPAGVAAWAQPARARGLGAREGAAAAPLHTVLVSDSAGPFSAAGAPWGLGLRAGGSHGPSHQGLLSGRRRILARHSTRGNRASRGRGFLEEVCRASQVSVTPCSRGSPQGRPSPWALPTRLARRGSPPADLAVGTEAARAVWRPR